MKCPRCGTENEPSAQFCGECGATVERKVCPRCGTANPAEAQFCEQCGVRITPIICPQCRAEVDPTKRFCTNCGKALDGQMAGGGASSQSGGKRAEGGGARPAEVPRGESQVVKPARPEAQKRKGRGCLGCGCLMLTLLLVLMLLVVGAGAAMYYRVPERVGLVKSPAERLLSGTPDRRAATELKEELAKGGIDTKGLDIYVLPVAGKESSVAIAVLDSSKGFRFGSSRGRDPLIDFMSQLSTSKTAKEAGIQRVAIDYRNDKGESLLALTTSVDAASGFARGGVSREEFMKKLEGRANWPAVTEEAMKWLQ